MIEAVLARGERGADKKVGFRLKVVFIGLQNPRVWPCAQTLSALKAAGSFSPSSFFPLSLLPEADAASPFDTPRLFIVSILFIRGCARLLDLRRR